MKKLESVLWLSFISSMAAVCLQCGGQAKKEAVVVEPAAVAPAPTAEPEASEAPADKAFIWKIESTKEQTKPFYLLGSIHAANEDFYPLDGAIEDAYKEAESLVVEVNLAAVSKEQMTQVVLTRAMLPPGQLLKEKLKPEIWEKLAAVLRQYQLPVEAVARFKPWFAALTLVTLRVAADGYNPALGIDPYFIAKGDKEILELETADFQLALFDSLPPELEQLLLLDAIEGNLQAGGELENVMDAWLEGDPDKLNEQLFGSIEHKPEFKPLFKKLITDRNYTMADGIEEFLAQGKSLFVVVGAGHLVGPEGLVAIFQGRGYKVEQIDKQGR